MRQAEREFQGVIAVRQWQYGSDRVAEQGLL